MLVKCCCGAFVALFLAALAGSAVAEDRDLSFLHALQTRGYGDTAIDFLQSVKKNPTASPAVAEVWDLEMSNSLRAEALSARDLASRADMLKQAQNHLDKFVRENPNNPGSCGASSTMSARSWIRPMRLLLTAQLGPEAEQGAKLAEARNQFEMARPRLEAVEKKLSQRIKELAQQLIKLGPIGRGATPTKKQHDLLVARAQLQLDLIRAQGQLSLIDYHIAQTFTDKADNAKRRDYLNKAAASLDAIYQRYRGDDSDSPAGRFALEAHSWYGKVDAELGADDDAKSIYDEVLDSFQDVANGPRPKRGGVPALGGRKPRHYTKTPIDDILARTKYFELLLLEKNKRHRKQYLTEAREFVENEEYKRNLNMQWGYQAAALDLANHLVEDFEKETKPTRQDQTEGRGAVKILADLVSQRTEFQDRAAKLQEKLSPGSAGKALSVEDAIYRAGKAQDDKNWPEVTQWLLKAQALEDAAGIEKRSQAALPNPRGLGQRGHPADFRRLQRCPQERQIPQGKMDLLDRRSGKGRQGIQTHARRRESP